MKETRHFLTLTDVTREELRLLLELGAAMKAGREPAGPEPLRGRTLLLLFSKPSTRTRISFQVGIYQLGGQAIDLRSSEMQINRGETVADTARVFSRYADAMVVRTFGHGELEEWRAHSSIPVINGLTDLYHPCQILADILTVKERKGKLEGLRVAYIGDGNNVLNSWITACCLADFRLVMCTPEGYDPDPVVLAAAAARGWRGAGPVLVRDPREAAGGADVIYTDVWTSMGQEEERERRLRDFGRYQVNEELVSLASPGALVMHCLPAHRGEEITAGIVDGPASVIFDQAENRLHMQKALLLFLMGEDIRRAGRPGPGEI